MTQAPAASTSLNGVELPDNWKPDTSAFGARLALLRWQLNFNMKEAALVCGFPAQSWRTWELDGTSPRDIVAVARQIADRTRCDYLWLLLGEQGKEALLLGDSGNAA
ncbi:hypothetical protein O7622_01060 [Micromonospora sp. WMMD1076]|uniref:hypothetical protein n=1 Tax=Micromonospora sp. WMMD1076 TaxID=3016103 RepID=UPI00249A5D2F|nr:hypothetical protein [Micromonospora sp. WMMD1076]WFF07219.1 hypothetical protein O7622_01060 [Micromonospora sp. WMMD1076]